MDCTSPMSAPAVYKIVLTGGPCAGKTSSTSVICERLQALGWRVYIVPETATLLFAGGASFDGLNSDQVQIFQTSILRSMLQLEDSFMDIATSSGKKSVVICDRGAMDVSAYMSSSAWKSLLAEECHPLVALRDERYHAVIHMVTAAEGAEPFYSLDSNECRKEPPALARTIDASILKSWVGHPYLVVADNSTPFDVKISKVLDAVCKHIGEPGLVKNVSTELVKRKFLVRVPAEFPDGIEYHDCEVEHHYLISQDGAQHRVRRRGHDGNFVYTHTRRIVRADQRIQIRRIVSKREYLQLMGQADPSRVSVLKRRRSFLCGFQNFELDTYIRPSSGLQLLECYVTGLEAEVRLPEWLEGVQEVTGRVEYSMYELSHSS